MAGDRKLCYQLGSHQTYSLPSSLQCHSNCCQYVSTIVNCKGSHCLSATFLKVQFCPVKSENSAGMGDEQFRLVVTHMETACTFYAYREVNIFSIPAKLYIQQKNHLQIQSIVWLLIWSQTPSSMDAAPWWDGWHWTFRKQVSWWGGEKRMGLDGMVSGSRMGWGVEDGGNNSTRRRGECSMT